MKYSDYKDGIFKQMYPLLASASLGSVFDVIIKCPNCGNEFADQISINYIGEEKCYGPKFCSQCGGSLLNEERWETILVKEPHWEVSEYLACDYEEYKNALEEPRLTEAEYMKVKEVLSRMKGEEK